MAIVVADAEECRFSLSPNRAESLRKPVQRLGGPTVFAHEAGRVAMRCTTSCRRWDKPVLVAMLGLVPHKPGEWVKADRGTRAVCGPATSPRCGCRMRSARRCGVWCGRMRPRAPIGCGSATGLTKLLLRLDVRPPAKMRPWRRPYRAWLATLQLEDGVGPSGRGWPTTWPGREPASVARDRPGDRRHAGRGTRRPAALQPAARADGLRGAGTQLQGVARMVVEYGERVTPVGAASSAWRRCKIAVMVQAADGDFSPSPAGTACSTPGNVCPGLRCGRRVRFASPAAPSAA